MQPSSATEQKQDANDSTTITRIAVLYAMIDEAKPLIDKLKLTESNEHNLKMKPFSVYKNKGDSIFLVVNGKCTQHNCDRVATQWATLATYLTIHTLSPDVIINAGTCGGVVAKYCFPDQDQNKTDNQANMNGDIEVNVGDVFVAQTAIYSDRRIPLPPWTKWGIGNYPLFGAAYLSSKIDALKMAPCVSTSNSFECTKQDKDMYQEYKVVCKDMECAAIAEMCTHFGSKLIAIKGVTDLVEHHDGEHFLQNLQTTVSNVTDSVVKVIDAVLNQKVSDVEQ